MGQDKMTAAPGTLGWRQALAKWQQEGCPMCVDRRQVAADLAAALEEIRRLEQLLRAAVPDIDKALAAHEEAATLRARCEVLEGLVLEVADVCECECAYRGEDGTVHPKTCLYCRARAATGEG